MNLVATQFAIADASTSLIDLGNQYAKDLEGLDFSCNQYTGEATEATAAGATPDEGTEATHAGATPEATKDTHEEATEAVTPKATNSNRVLAEEASDATNAGATPEEITEAANEVLDEGANDDVLTTTGVTTKGVTTEHLKDKKTCTASIKMLKEHADLLGEFSKPLEAFEDNMPDRRKPGSFIKEFLMDPKHSPSTPDMQPVGTSTHPSSGTVLGGTVIPSPSTPDMQPVGTSTDPSSGTVLGGTGIPSPCTPDMQPEGTSKDPSSGTVLGGTGIPSPPTPDMQPEGTTNPLPSTPDMQLDGTRIPKPSSTPDKQPEYTFSPKPLPDDSTDDSGTWHPEAIFNNAKSRIEGGEVPIAAKAWPVKRKTDDDSDNESTSGNKAKPFKIVPWPAMFEFC